MANVAKGFGVGDTVQVYYKNHATLRTLPQARTVKKVNVDSAGNNATVEFTDGEQVPDVSTDQRVFTTAALCANKIIDDLITDYDACAVLNSTTSGASTAGQATLGITRSNT